MPNKRKRGGKPAPNQQPAIPSVGPDANTEESAGPKDLLMPSSTESAPIFRILTPELAAADLSEKSIEEAMVEALATQWDSTVDASICKTTAQNCRDWIAEIDQAIEDAESVLESARSAQHLGVNARAAAMAHLCRKAWGVCDQLLFIFKVESPGVAQRLKPFVLEALKTSAVVASAAKKGEISDWSIGRWPASLTVLRQELKCFGKELLGDLDQATEAPTIWFHGERSYSADGREPVVVPPEQHNALQEFLRRRTALDTSALNKAGLNNVTKVMKAISEAFRGAVRMPAKKGQGYFIRVQTKTATG